MGGRARTRYYHVATHLIHYLILPRILKIQITENSFWVQCPTFIIPASGTSPESPNHSESGFFSDNKYVVSLPTATSFPNTHWVSSKSVTSDLKSVELLQILQVEGSRSSSVQMPAKRFRVTHACDQIGKIRVSMTSLSNSTAL